MCSSDLSLMIDYDVFYEFIPMDEFGSENPTVVPLWGVEVGICLMLSLGR